MAIHGKGVGVYSKMSGSGSPSFVLADQPDPEVVPQHFQVKAHRGDEEGEWYLSIVPGYCGRVEAASGVFSTGNRDVLDGFRDIADSSGLGSLELRGNREISENYLIDRVNAHKGMRFEEKENVLSEGQQYLCPEDITYVFLYASHPGAGLKLGVVGKAVYESHFRYYTSGGYWGCTPVILTRHASELTIERTGGTITDVVLSDQTDCNWERIALYCRPLAYFKKSTEEFKQFNLGHQAFDIVSETYAKGSTIEAMGTPPAIVDGNWAAFYYKTGAPNAPTGYTFDEEYAS